MQNYILCEIRVELEMLEIISAELAELGFEGFIETESGLEAYIPENEFSKEAILDLFERYGLTSESFHMKTVEQQNWNAMWESNFEPVEIDKRLRILAPFHERDSSFELELIIQPKTSFGTGHHETTFTIMDLILSEQLLGKQVFDYGSGTGILAILASKLGAKKILANDIDEWAAENIYENMALNSVSNIEFIHGDLKAIPAGKFDLILANINKNILMSSFASLRPLLKDQGDLIISGFYDTDLPDLLHQANQCGFVLKKKVVKNNWTAAILGC